MRGRILWKRPSRIPNCVDKKKLYISTWNTGHEASQSLDVKLIAFELFYKDRPCQCLLEMPFCNNNVLFK